VIRAAALALAVSGCSGYYGTEIPPTSQELYHGSTPVRVRNASAINLCYLYVVPDGHEEWGSDWLEAAQVLHAGQTTQLSIAAGTYQLRAEICDHRVVAEHRSLALTGPREIVLHDQAATPTGDPPAGFTRIPLSVGPIPEED
jgi:hypothetical protein